MKSFNNQVVAITGAASGMGRSLAPQLARKDCHPALADRNEAALAQTLQLVRTHEGNRIRVTTYAVDVVDRVAVYRWAEEAAAVHDRANLIFNNAGVALFSAIEGTEDDELAWIMDINSWGVVHGTEAFLPLLKAANNGHIINTSSIPGILAQSGTGTYNISRCAIRGYTEALRQELDLMDRGVPTTCAHLGGIKTNIAKSSRISPSMNGFLVRDEQQSKAELEKFFITSADKAVQVILGGVRKNKCRVLIGPDAHAADVTAHVLPAAYQVLVVRGARRTRKRILRDDTASAIACAK